jgi:hypothetical protein
MNTFLNNVNFLTFLNDQDSRICLNQQEADHYRHLKTASRRKFNVGLGFHL